MNNEKLSSLFVALIKFLLIAVIFGEACFALLFLGCLAFGDLDFGVAVRCFAELMCVILFIVHSSRARGKVSRIDDDKSIFTASSSLAVIALELCVLYIISPTIFYSESFDWARFLVTPLNFLILTGMICFVLHTSLAKKNKASPFFAAAIILFIVYLILWIINFTSYFTDASNYYSNILENAPVITEDGEERLLIVDEHFRYTSTEAYIREDYNNLKLSLTSTIIEMMLILPLIGVLIDFFVLTRKRKLTYICLNVSFASYILYLILELMMTVYSVVLTRNGLMVLNLILEETIPETIPEIIFATAICALCVAIWLYTKGTEQKTIENRLVKLKLRFARGEVDESEYNEKKIALLNKL